jgi:hypothetical protein
MSGARFRSGLLGVLLFSGGLPLEAQFAATNWFTPPPFTTNVIGITWNPSPSESVTGYRVCWGLTPATCTNRLDVGDVSVVSLTFLRLQTNATYFLTVLARDDLGDESPPSNMISYQVSPVRFALRARKPGVRIAPPTVPVTPQVPSLVFSGRKGESYHLLASTNLLEWEVAFTTNCASDGPVSLSPPYSAAYPQRFFQVIGP